MLATERTGAVGLARAVAGRPPSVRWVWDDTSRRYPAVLEAGARVERCVDLRLCRAILRSSTLTAGSALARLPRDAWDEPPRPRDRALDALFEVDDARVPALDPIEELRRQVAATESSSAPDRVRLLLAAENVGALCAVEMTVAGVPWDAARHDEILRGMLGPRPASGRPERMEVLLREVRAALDLPELNPDSPVELLKGLQSAGLRVSTTRSGELRRVEHPAIAPLLEYKRLARLLAANGWHWLEEWVHGGRFHPVYVPGGVVTGRWASHGGGALQLPKEVRGAVVADPGWKLVVADAAQLEPRVLAAMSGDDGMARAGRAQDLYAGMVDSGAVETRRQAKYGMLGAIYGGTAGESGRMRPRIARAFPRAMAFGEEAARAGERGEVVTTWLGRSSPPRAAGGYDETATEAELRRVHGDARSWGRFTRNFVVQGTAAEWALCWMGTMRRRLWELGAAAVGPDAPLTERPHLVFFLHDELMVHTPAALAVDVERAFRESAAEAGRLLFGRTPVEFAVTVDVVDSYADAT